MPMISRPRHPSLPSGLYRRARSISSAAPLVILGLATGCSGGSSPGSATAAHPPERLPRIHRSSAVVASIRLADPPASIAAGAGAVWALTRDPSVLYRIDPASNRVIGQPTRLPDGRWNVAVGAGYVWLTPNGADGRLLRIDPRSGRISARISARPVYFGSVITFSARYVFTGNDDERYRGGRTVTRLDPHSGRLVGKPLVLGSPQSIAFGHGAVWVGDHTGWLFKIDPDRFRVLARTRLRFGPHGVVVSGNGVYVAATHNARIVKADPESGRIEASGRLPIGPIYPVAGADALWSGSSAGWEDPAKSDDRLMRIDPNRLRATRIYHLGAKVAAVAYGFGSLWVALGDGSVARLRVR
ncbi:MAG: virginiamycin lyase [Thermoleophilaceae bacterium]|jgi:hypothetical protein|nr:virginiamycin lyase [Thermoleophilaceae bacterium]